MKTKKLLAGALILAMATGCLSGCAAPKTETPQIDGYNLLWSDEFDGNKLDETKWNKELRDPGWTNNELQEYTDSEQNIYVKDGCLNIKAIKTTDENGNDYYTSGKVQGQNKTDFMYGKVVISAKVPEGQGLWPALHPKEV